MIPKGSFHMASLFRNRFTRPVAPRRRRVRAAAPAMPLERLEPRLALAGDTVSRPMLERAATLVMDASVGPNPVVMSKSQVVGNDVKSFVISHVPDGSVVEKWDAATETWIDVSTKPTSSNPQELMRLLGTRVIHQGDRIQWRPKSGFEGAAQQAFQMINWDDGSELLGVSAEAPSAVQNLAVNPTGVAELTVTWEPPATGGDATSYSVTINSGSDPVTYFTSNTSYTFSDLNTFLPGYTFSVTASNAEGTSPAANVSYVARQTAIGVGTHPRALTTGLDGSIWVANQGSNTVQQIVNDSGDWTAQPAIGVGSRPRGLTTGLDGSIWVANLSSNTVQQITNIAGVWTAQPAISVGYAPIGLTTGLDGSIWVSNFGEGSNTVQQIVNDNGVWTAQPAIGVGSMPVSLTTGLDGSIWVANYMVSGDSNSGTVQQIVNDNGVWTAQPAIWVGGTALALTTGLDGSIWVANHLMASVQQIVNDNGVWTVQPFIKAFGYPNYLTTGLDGSIWVSNNRYAERDIYNSVQQILKDNGDWTAQPGMMVYGTPVGLTTGLDGSIWMSSYSSATVGQILFSPNAPPRELAAAFGEGSGEMTLSWQPPVIVGGTDVISYTATVSQGMYTKTITTSDTSCVFDGLTLGTGPTYFTVTATNFLGESKAAALQIDAYGNPIPS
jgi:streptogramin lyase